MPDLDHYVYLFDGYRLDSRRRSLMRGASEVALGSRALDLLIALVESADGVLSHEDLVSRVWPTTFVESSSLRVHVAALRRAFQADPGARQRIVNVPGRGYSFIGPVSKEPRTAPLSDAPAVSRAAAAAPRALPTLLGRETTLAAMEAMLSQRRTLTIVGPGGIGKTSVALHLLSRQADAFGGNALRIDLSQGRPGQLLEQASEALGQPPSRVMAALQYAPLLLLLDNCEHVLEDVAAFADAVSMQSPFVQLVCTSREPLHVAEERVIRLDPLKIAPASVSTLEAALDFPAIGLLVARAKAAAGRVVFDDADVPLLRGLCEMLDGVPLAIEFAAARIESLGLSGLLERPESLLDVLTQGRRNAAPRHRTLRTVMDWSYDLLDTDERRVFCTLSLFGATFSLTRAAAVAGAASGTAGIEEIVLALVDKSVLISCPEAGKSEDGTCFRLSGMLQRYGRERLADMPDAPHIRARHAQEVLRSVRLGVPGQQSTTAV